MQIKFSQEDIVINQHKTIMKTKKTCGRNKAGPDRYSTK